MTSSPSAGDEVAGSQKRPARRLGSLRGITSLSLARTLRKQQHGKPPTGTWITVAVLTVSGTAQPPFLALPFGIAQLGWVGGMVALVGAGGAAVFASILLTLLHHHGGGRLTRYHEMSSEILGKDKLYGSAIIYVFQWAVNLGVICVNLILSAGLIQTIWLMFCAPDACPHMSNTKWTLVMGGAALLLSQIPNLEAIQVAAALTSLFCIAYTAIAVVLSLMRSAPVSFAIVGSPASKGFDALNALGIIFFAYGTTIVPEVQATLRSVPPSDITTRPMVAGTLAGFAVILPMYLLVSVVGYLKFGNATPGFLLQGLDSPAWLVALAEGMCIVQLLIALQIYALPLFEQVETWLLKRSHSPAWMRRKHSSTDDAAWVQPSLALTLVTRPPFILGGTVIAAALPFFSSILGLVGAVGLTPLTYVLPAVLYLEANKGSLPRWQRLGLVAFAALFTVIGLGAAVGAMWLIITTASAWHWFP